MHDWLPSCAAKLTFCPQTLCVFCTDQIDGSEILLKLILGENHRYNSSIYLIHIPLHIIYTNFVSATSFKKYKHWMCVRCDVATVYKGVAGHTIA